MPTADRFPSSGIGVGCSLQLVFNALKKTLKIVKTAMSAEGRLAGIRADQPAMVAALGSAVKGESRTTAGRGEMIQSAVNADEEAGAV